MIKEKKLVTNIVMYYLNRLITTTILIACKMPYHKEIIFLTLFFDLDKKRSH